MSKGINIRQILLTDSQREGLAERVEDLVDTTSYDWQLEPAEHNEAIKYWSDILRELLFKERADKLDKDYSI